VKAYDMIMVRMNIMRKSCFVSKFIHADSIRIGQNVNIGILQICILKAQTPLEKKRGVNLKFSEIYMLFLSMIIKTRNSHSSEWCGG